MPPDDSGTEGPEASAAAVPEPPSRREVLGLRLRQFRESLGITEQIRNFLLVSAPLFGAALALAFLGFLEFATVPALLGFGLCLVALLHTVFPSLADWTKSLSRPASIGFWAVLSGLLAFVGFSSAIVIVLVLFLGGLMLGLVLWRFLGRVLTEAPVGREATVEAEGSDHRTFVGTVAVLIAGSLTGSFLMGYLRLHEEGPLGIALVTGNTGLLLGILPALAAMLGVAGATRPAPGTLFRRLLRDVLFVTTLAGLIGYETALALDGQASLPFAPTFVLLLLVLLGYLGVLGRFFLSLRTGGLPPNPFFVASVGMLLLFAPAVVLLSSAPATFTRLYGAAQAAGLLAVVLYLGLSGPWRDEFRELSARLQEAMSRGVSFQVSIGDGSQDGSGTSMEGRRQGFFARRRARREEKRSGG